LANTPQAKKAARQNDKQRQLNKTQRTQLYTLVKNVSKAIKTQDKKAAESAYKLAVPVIDRMAGKKIIRKHKAARYKSRLNTRIKALAA